MYCNVVYALPEATGCSSICYKRASSHCASCK
jgi:hypothetical protein